MSRVHASAVALASIAAVTALAACSSSGNDTAAAPTSSSPATSTSATSTAPTATTSSGPATTGSSSATSATPAPSAGSACAESQLKASVQAQDLSSIGYHAVRLIFTNTSNTECTLTGYPGAAIVDGSGKQVQQAKRTIGGPVAGTVEQVATIPVAPGKAVFAYLEGQSTKEQGAAQAGCDGAKYPRILVTPPNTKVAVPFTIGWPLCYAFNVHPVRTQ